MDVSLESRWITARHACSLSAQFEYLCKAVRTDVNARNEFRERQDIEASRFRFDRRNSGSLAVVTRTDDKSVTIAITDDSAAIEIRGHTDREMTFTAVLDDQLKCVLIEVEADGVCIPKTERPVEDLPRLILDRLFFDSGSDIVRRR